MAERTEVDRGLTRGPDGEAVFYEPFPLSLRITIGLGGALTLLAPYELLVKPRVDLLTPAMLPFWIISAGALSIGTVFITAAALGATKAVAFIPTLRIMRAEGRAAFSLRWQREYPLHAVSSPKICEDQYSDGDPVYRLTVDINGRKSPFEVHRFGTMAAAEHGKRTIEEILAFA